MLRLATPHRQDRSEPCEALWDVVVSLLGFSHNLKASQAMRRRAVDHNQRCREARTCRSIRRLSRRTRRRSPRTHRPSRGTCRRRACRKTRRRRACRGAWHLGRSSWCSNSPACRCPFVLVNVNEGFDPAATFLRVRPASLAVLDPEHRCGTLWTPSGSAVLLEMSTLDLHTPPVLSFAFGLRPRAWWR